jgi:gamma-glutamyl-gamma-aminobutyrate hydrolase PuuD
MPIIAIAPCAKQHDYEESIRRAGGDVKILSYATDPPADVVASVDGILLAGGGDVLPSLYGEARHAAFDAAEPGRDDYELDLARRAADANLPLLAICRGIQVLNVARGGTLVQHIPEALRDGVNHTLREPSFAIAHDIWISEGSRLEDLMRERLTGDTLPVNSRHHQAVKDVGRGLVVTATAPDGVIEAVEDPEQRFCLGVQWHPENFYRTGEFRELFEGFVAAAARRN